MQYVSHSSYLVSIGVIARLIYIYETTVKQIFALDCTKSCLRAQNFLGGHAPRPPKRCREQLIKCNPKCPNFHDPAITRWWKGGPGRGGGASSEYGPLPRL